MLERDNKIITTNLEVILKYIEIYEDIKERILNKKYQSWSPLDGEVMLCNYYGVSRTTIRKAVSMLKKEGFIHSRQGSGIFVNPPEFYEDQTLKSLSEKLDSHVLKTKVVKFEKNVKSKELAETFNIHPDSNFFYYLRVRIIDEVPKVIEETYMPEFLFKEMTKSVVEKSMFDFIENVSGYKISHDSKEIKGVHLTKEEARLLNRRENEIALEITHKVYLIKSILAQYTKEILIDNFFKVITVK